jgi:HTH-type transcriptional regulator / antitoxin HigA
VFGAPAEHFLVLQANCDLALARRTRTLCPRLSERLRLYGDLPISEMIKRGWLSARALHDTETVETSLMSLFGVVHTSEIDGALNAVRCDDGSRKTLAHLAWIGRVREIAARTRGLRRYTADELRQTLPALRAKMRTRDGVGHVPSLLADCGVGFALIEPLKGGELDGGCIWLDDGTPVIALALRHDRLDYFWLVLRHEIDHVLNSTGSTPVLDLVLDQNLERTDAGIAADEHAANEAAHAFCVSPEDVDAFLTLTGSYVTEQDILDAAGRLCVHPGILLAQVSRRIGRQHRFRRFAPKVRAHLAPHAIVDGWGTTPDGCGVQAAASESVAIARTPARQPIAELA